MKFVYSGMSMPDMNHDAFTAAVKEMLDHWIRTEWERENALWHILTAKDALNVEWENDLPPELRLSEGF